MAARWRHPELPMRPLLLPACLALVLSCVAAPAAAGAADEAMPGVDTLDLSLPQDARAGYRNDPPGTWYGDTSGVPAAAEQPRAFARRPACPTSPDGAPTDITGVVEAGIGHSSRGGNSNWQAATLNYCKEYATDDGGSRTLNVQLNVGAYDGPHDIHGLHGFHGPYGPHGPYGGFGGYGTGLDQGYRPGYGPGWGPGPVLLQREAEVRPSPRRRGEGR